jgi:putative tricarboxylic transport membrane protein
MVSFKVKWLDLILSLFSIVMFVGVFVLSASFPEPHEAQLGASVFPRIIAIILAVVSIYIAFSSMKKKTQATVKIDNATKVFISFLILLLYGLFLKKVGFIILTPIFIAALLFLMRFSSVLINILTSILTTAGIYIVFKVLLSVPLPEGILGF